MQLSKSLLSLLAFSHHISANPYPYPSSTPSTSTPLPIQLQPIFTANLILGKPYAPIAIPGGVLINEPITGGSVSGQGINGTIQGGFAHPAVYENGTLQVPVIDVYGVSEDGESFYIYETGVGSIAAQVTRIVGFFFLFFSLFFFLFFFLFMVPTFLTVFFPLQSDLPFQAINEIPELTNNINPQELSIGGAKYKALRDGFILASVNANANRTAVAVQGFLVVNTLL